MKVKDLRDNPTSFVFDKIYHMVLKDSALVHPESAPSIHPRMPFFKVYSFVSYFPTNAFIKLN